MPRTAAKKLKSHRRDEPVLQHHRNWLAQEFMSALLSNPRLQRWYDADDEDSDFNLHPSLVAKKAFECADAFIAEAGK